MSARRCNPGGGHLRHLGLVEDRVVLVTLPPLGPLAGVAEFLGVEVGVLVPDRLQVDAQVDQDFLGDDRRQEPVECLLGAAVGIIGEVGQGVDQGAGQGRGVPHLEPRLLRLALGRDAEDDLGLVLIGPDRAGEGFRLEHAVDVGREGHLGGVGFLVGQRLHPDDRLAFMGDLHPPVDPVLASGRDLHGLGRRVQQARARCPRTSSTTCTDFFVFSLLWTLAESTTSSFWTKNRGAWSRTSRSFVVMISASPWPTLVPGPSVQVLTFQVVRLSGIGNSTSAVPSAAVVRAAAQKAVSAKLVRTTGWTGAAAARPSNESSEMPSPAFALERSVREAPATWPSAPAAFAPGRCGFSHRQPATDATPPYRPCRHLHAAPAISRLVPRESPKAPRSCMGDLVRLRQVRRPAVEARLGLGMVGPLPLPEDCLDIGDVRTARDVFDGLVIDGHHRRTHERLAVGAGELDLDLGLLAGLVRLLGGSTATFTTRDSGGMAISRASSWTLPSATVRASTKMLGMSPRHDADLLDGALAPQVDDLRRQVNAVRRPDEEQHRGVDLVGVDQEPERLAGLILLLLGDDLQVVESEARAVEPLPGDREQVAAFDHVAVAVVDRGREPVLARGRCLDRLTGLAVGVERDVPALDGRLDRLSLGVVGDLEQLERPLAGDRLVGERLGADLGLDRVARAVVAAIDPGIDAEGLAGDQHGPRADDRAAGLVGDLGRDLVPLVLVRVGRPGDRGVDLDGERAIGPDRHLGLGDDFGRAGSRSHHQASGRSMPQRDQPGYHEESAANHQ